MSHVGVQGRRHSRSRLSRGCGRRVTLQSRRRASCTHRWGVAPAPGAVLLGGHPQALPGAERRAGFVWTPWRIHVPRVGLCRGCCYPMCCHPHDCLDTVEAELTKFSFFFFKSYLFSHEREKEAETQAEGEAGSMQGAQRGTRSRVSRVTPWAEGRR